MGQGIGDLDSGLTMFRFRSTLWATEPNKVVKSKKKNLLFDKNDYKYMGEGHFSPDLLGSSNFGASIMLKAAQNG